ncbi:hypothetical protein B0T18DRAFT_406980 [Schizothecium vesticola]|uniref:Uncharacterized protein n=1 Tax=Schizothecium vesticola TaxID=314040 RepID=A0AA40F1L4_9PEZI|nr:hypothetical protein B0T18DRAFT_406980 [Schizothecium vesticola]
MSPSAEASFFLDWMTASSLIKSPTPDARSHSRILNQILVHVGDTLGELAQSAMLIKLKKSSWASMRGGALRIDKSTTEIEAKDSYQTPVEGCISITGPWRVCSGFSAAQGNGEGRSVLPSSRLRISQLPIFGTASRKHRHWPPPHRRRGHEKTRMLDARPRVRQEHEKAASRHCLARRRGPHQESSAEREREGPPTARRGSLALFQQSRFGWYRGDGA